MSLTSNLKSVVLNSTPINMWTAGDSIKTMLPIVQDIQSIAAAVDSIDPISGTLTADIIIPKTSGAGTSITIPLISGSAYASPTVLTTSQSGSTCLFNAAAGNVFTLPAATAANAGITFKFKQTATVTSNFAIIQGATSSDLFIAGSNITQVKGTATPTVAYYSPNGSSNYQYKVNGSTTGGIIGDIIEVICTGLNAWLINGTQSASGTVATPFAG